MYLVLLVTDTQPTDKRTDVWSQDFIIWKINSGLWAVAWAGLDCGKNGSWPIMSNFWGLFFHFFMVKKIKKKKLTPKKWKNGPQKLLIIGPDPFFPQSSPGHSPQPRIDFSYYEISGPDICTFSYLWMFHRYKLKCSGKTKQTISIHCE